MKNLDFRLAKISDISQLTNLMNAQYDRQKGESYFLWQYFHTCQATVLMCAFLGVKTVGMFGLQKRRLHNGTNVGQAIDLLVVPECREKGLFFKLGERVFKCFEDLDLLIVLPNLNGKNACEKSLKWKTLSRINSMSVHVKNLNIIKDKQNSFSGNPKQGKLVFMFHYDEIIRNWRYNQHPEYQYDYITLDSDKFAITKIFIDPITGQHFGDIVDFECDLNNKTVLKELFLKASLHLKEKGVESITTWAFPHTPLRQVVDSLGFVEMPIERYFCVKVLNPKYEYLYDFSRWHLVQADAEIY